MGSVSSVWFILFGWLNQAKRVKQSNQPSQVNQTNPVSPACLAPLSFGVPNFGSIIHEHVCARSLSHGLLNQRHGTGR